MWLWNNSQWVQEWNTMSQTFWTVCPLKYSIFSGVVKIWNEIWCSKPSQLCALWKIPFFRCCQNLSWLGMKRSGVGSSSSLLNISTSHSKTSCAGPPLFLTIRYVLTEDFKIIQKCFISSDGFLAIFVQLNLNKLISRKFCTFAFVVPWTLGFQDIIFVDNLDIQNTFMLSICQNRLCCVHCRNLIKKIKLKYST